MNESATKVGHDQMVDGDLRASFARVRRKNAPGGRVPPHVFGGALGAILAVVALSPSLRAAPEAEAAAGRALLKRYAEAVVGIELVVTVKIKVGDREAPPQEQSFQANGTVISPTGLTVTSLASVDPQVSFDAARSFGRSRGAEMVGTDYREVKLRLADGKEVPARFVLKDADLDLAFMAPEASETPREFTHVNLAEAADGAVLGSYFYVSRASKAMQRIPIVRPSEIIGIVEKPRRFYLMTDYGLGAPMFDLKGKVIGIAVQHIANRSNGLIVLPAVDIADMAKQAAAAQAAPK